MPPALRYLAVGATGAGELRFHRRLTVLSGFGTSGGERLARAVEPRDGPPEGLAELGGEPIALADVPAARRCPTLLDARTLRRELRRLGDVARREIEGGLADLDRLAAEVTARRDAVARRIDALDHVVVSATSGDYAPAEDDRAEPAAGTAGPDRDLAEIERLVAEFEATAALPPEAHPEAGPLADELAEVEQLLAGRRERRPAEASPVPRVALAEATRRRQDLQRAEQRARRRFFSRRERAGRDRARAELDDLLAGYGVSSYGELAVLPAAGPAPDRVTADATGPGGPPGPDRHDTNRLLDHRAALLRQAVALLGLDPGPDVVAALRSHRVEAARRTAARADLVRALRERGIDVDGPPEVVARAWLARRTGGRPSEADPPPLAAAAVEQRPATPAAAADDEATAARVERLQRSREYERLGAELADLDLDRRTLENHARRIDVETLRGKLEGLGPLTVERLLWAALSPEAQPGPVAPFLLDGLLAHFAPRARCRAWRVLVEASESVQIIVVCDEPDVEEWARLLPADTALVLTPADAPDVTQTPR